MKKSKNKNFLQFIFFAGIVMVSACDNKKNSDPGWLEGTISIGPICPVESVPPDPDCLPTAETYKAYPVSVFSSDGKNQITQLAPSLDGSFSSELPPGNYLIMLNKTGHNIGGSNLPAEVSITSHDKTILDISIDTGIR